MKLPRRNFLRLAASASTLPVASRVAKAQTYPTRPVRIIVGFPAGGQIDIIARLIGQWLSDRLGQQFFIDNRPGAASNIAAEAVVRSPADGYTLFLANGTNAVNATLYDNLRFNFVRDIAPIASICRIPLVLYVHPSFPAKTVSELIAYAKANPGKVTIATPQMSVFGDVRVRARYGVLHFRTDRALIYLTIIESRLRPPSRPRSPAS